MTKTPTFREVLSSALAYWEKRRLVYNTVLLLVTLVMVVLGQPETTSWLTVSGLVGFLTLAVMANVLYSVAYIPDIAFQLSAYRERWLRWRTGLFWFGLGFAALLTFWVLSVGLVSLGLSNNS
jgi:hypothetical protein